MRESIDPILTERPTPTEPAPVAHRFDEFPAGYPWAGCSPAEPASVSPTKFRMPHNGNVGDDSSANGNPSPSQLPQGWGSLQWSVPFSTIGPCRANLKSRDPAFDRLPDLPAA